MTAVRIVLRDDDLMRLRLLLADAAGLVFEDSRRDSLSYSVAERLRLTGIPDVATYLDLVCVPGSAERQCLLDEVTIQETHFFRNPPQMQALREHVLPELVRAAAAGSRRLRVWSAGCSTGEEPYTIAMMLRELLPSTDGWDVRVIATDIAQAALATARRATYGDRAVQLATPEELARFFVPTADGQHAVRPEVRELVEFAHHNLVLDAAPDSGFDLVLCRNVTIYFSRETTRALVGRLHACLRDGGYLFLGHSETLWQVNDDFRLVALGVGESTAFVYRRAEVAAPRPVILHAAPPAERRPAGRRARLGLARLRVEGLLPRQPDPAGPTIVDAAGAIRAALVEGRYDEAARLARLASETDPLRAELHYLHGLALVDLGRDLEALPPLRRAIYLEPDGGLAHFLLAGALARSGDVLAAAREYRAAASTLGRDPQEATAHELGGRSVRELATLCAQLEGELTRAFERSSP